MPDHDETPGRPPDGERVTFRREDFVLLRRAARAKWGVPDEVQTEALWQAVRILTDFETGPREKIAVMRFLVAADRTDLLAEAAATRDALLRLKLATPDDEAHPGGVDPEAAARALKALNGEDAT